MTTTAIGIFLNCLLACAIAQLIPVLNEVHTSNALNILYDKLPEIEALASLVHTLSLKWGSQCVPY